MHIEYIIFGIILIFLIAIFVGLVCYFNKRPVLPPLDQNRWGQNDYRKFQDTSVDQTPINEIEDYRETEENEDFGMYEDSLMYWLGDVDRKAGLPYTNKDFLKLRDIGSVNIPPNLQDPYEFDQTRFKNQGKTVVRDNPVFKNMMRT